MVSYSTKVVELLDEECGEVLSEAQEKMKIESVSTFETMFKDYLSIGPLRTTLRDKYLKGDYDDQLLGWDCSSTLPMSAKKLLDAISVDIKKKVALRVQATNKMANLALQQLYSSVRLHSMCASHSSYRV